MRSHSCWARAADTSRSSTRADVMSVAVRSSISASSSLARCTSAPHELRARPARGQSAGDSELRRAPRRLARVHRSQRHVLLGLGEGPLGGHPPTAFARASRAHGYRRRHRVRDRVRGRAARTQKALVRDAFQHVLGLPLHDSEPRSLPVARPVHRADHGDDRDRARWLHPADPVPQHPRGTARRACGRPRGRARNGPDGSPGSAADRPPARTPRDLGRSADRGGDNHQPCDRRRVHHTARPRPTDLLRARDRLHDRVRRNRRAGDRARNRGRRPTCPGAANAHPVGARTEAHGVTFAFDTFKPHTFVDAFRFMADNPGLMWDKTVEHLQISGEAMGVALLIAIPLGIFLGHIHRGSFISINLANILRALPSLAVIAIGLGVFGIGTTNVVFALVVLAFPLMLTNAYVAVDNIDPDVIESARGMGMRPHQILLRIELPLALPLIFAGIKTAAVFVVATATLGGIVGGGGLGDIIVNQASYFLKGVVAASIAVAALAFAANFAFALLQRAVTPRPLRKRLRAIEPDVSTGVAEAVTA